MPLKGPIRSVFSTGEGLFDRLLCVLGAATFSQVPEFMQQYLQRLGGHLDEAGRQLDQLRAAAARSGLTLEQLTAHTAAAGDPAVARLGAVLKEATGRVEALAAAEAAIRHASILARPFVFLGHLDPAIARATWSIFKPALPTTVEGLIYALVGVLVFLGTYHFGIRRPVARAWRARTGRRETTDVAT
jgi:hypothetical protein